MQPGTRKPRQSRDNDYEIDREDQKVRTYTGILNGSIQDRAIQETMGYVYDRTKEHLGSADTAIIMMRRLLMKLARELAALVTREHGKTLPDAVGEVGRGLEVVEHACSITSLQLGDFGNNAANGMTQRTCLDGKVSARADGAAARAAAPARS